MLEKFDPRTFPISYHYHEYETAVNDVMAGSLLAPRGVALLAFIMAAAYAVATTRAMRVAQRTAAIDHYKYHVGMARNSRVALALKVESSLQLVTMEKVRMTILWAMLVPAMLAVQAHTLLTTKPWGWTVDYARMFDIVFYPDAPPAGPVTPIPSPYLADLRNFFLLLMTALVAAWVYSHYNQHDSRAFVERVRTWWTGLTAPTTLPATTPPSQRPKRRYRLAA